VPVSVADLAKYYADTPPPKNDSLANLEARLEALSSASYRSPFKFEPSSLASLAGEAFGTPKYGQLSPYTSVADVLKAPSVPNVASLYPLHRAAGLTTPGATTVSELFAQRYGTQSNPLSEALVKRYGTSPGVTGVGKFLYDGGNALDQALETLRQQLEKFGMFMQYAPLALQNIQRTLEAIRLRPPFLYDALDTWEAFLQGDIEALDRFIVDHLDRRPDDRTRLAVQQRLERAFGMEGSPIPEWAGDPNGFDVGVFRLVQRQIRAEEAAKIDEVQRLRDAGVDRVRMGFEKGLRLRKVMAQDLGLDHEQFSIDGKLKDHYVRVRFPGAVLVARAEQPHLPDTPSRKREPNLRSYTVTSVEREAAEGIIKEWVVGRPLEPTKHGNLAVPFDPKEDYTRPPSVVTVLREESHIEVFEAQERERGQLNQLRDAMRRAGLSPGEEVVMRLKLEGLRNKDIAARLGCSAGQVGVQARRGREKVRGATRG
jgi:DNA-binding CsgD family transcriptional regulator